MLLCLPSWQALAGLPVGPPTFLAQHHLTGVALLPARHRGHARF